MTNPTAASGHKAVAFAQILGLTEVEIPVDKVLSRIL
jgi:hypothetical protein